MAFDLSTLSNAEDQKLYSYKVSRIIAWGIAGLVLLGFTGNLALDLAGCLPAQSSFALNNIQSVPFVQHLLSVVPAIAFSVLGALIITYLPENRIGWLSSFLGLAIILAHLSLEYGVCAQRGSLDLPFGITVLWLRNLFTALFAALLLLFINLFPNGRFVSRRWQRFSLIMLSAFGLFTLLALFWPGQLLADLPELASEFQNPYAFPFEPAPLWNSFILKGKNLMGLTFGLPSILSLFARWRRAEEEVQQQIKWLVFFLMTSGILFISVEFVGYTVYPEIFFSWFYALELLIFFVGFPIVLGVAVFKYRLYDIDFIIGRTLVYGLLTLTLVAVYFGSVVLLQSLFADLIGGSSPLAIVLSTLLIASLFQPIRDRLQRSVNRVVYGQRDNPLAVLEQLGDVLVSSRSPSHILPRYAETIASSLKLPYVAIRMRDAELLNQVASAGIEQTQVYKFPLTYHNKDQGHLVVSPQQGHHKLNSAERRLLEQITTQTAAAVHAVRLSSELQRSRQRIVTTREEERRRLRRDLHDGLGPVLSGQGLKLSAASHLLDKKPDEVRQLLDEVLQQNEDTVNQLRRVVYDLRPPALDDLGLVRAIEFEGRNFMGDVQLNLITVPEPLPDLPAAVEVAAYRIVMEALTNACRHAKASACHVRLQAEDTLLVEVKDNGIGFSTNGKPGVGLASMRERAAELGGEFSIGLNNEGGTYIKALLPC